MKILALILQYHLKQVQESKSYFDIPIRKLECVGQIQKRLGTRCRTLRQTYKGKKLSDSKGISGKGRLTDKAINTLQSYCGMAIFVKTAT